MNITSELNKHVSGIQEKSNFFKSELGWRLLSVCVSLTFFHLYSKTLFIVFMANEGFFSYDFFSSGGGGLEIFFATGELMLIILSISSLGFVIPIIEWIYKKKFPLKAFCFWLPINFFIASLLGIGVSKSGNATFLFFSVIFGLAVFINIYIGILLHHTAKRTFRTLCILLGMVISLTAIAPEQISELLKIGLSVYRVGGDIPITVTDKSGAIKQGTLVFLSPDNVYLRLLNKTEITVLRRGDSLDIAIGKKTKVKI